MTDNTYTATISDRTVVVFSGESAVQSDGSITRTFGKTETITLVAVLQNTAGATANLTVVGGDTGFSTTLSITNNYTDQN